MNLSENLCRLRDEFERRVWKPIGYFHFTLTDPKTRSIFAPYYADRVVQHCLCDNIVAPILEKKLIFDNAACRIGKGTHFSLNRLTGFLSEFHKKHGSNGYFLKIDIRKYFDSIRHDVLKEKLNKVFKDRDIFNLLCLIIDSYEIQPGVGLPLGNQVSQWFALYYLDSLDRLIKEKMRIRYYTRYMDDFVILHESRDFLTARLTSLRETAECDLGLIFNEKTQISPIRNGVRYLGFHIYLSDSGKIIRKVTAQTKKRYKKLLKKMVADYADDRIDLDYIKPRINSYNAHLSHGHTYRLRNRLSKMTLFRRKDIFCSHFRYRGK